MGAPLDDLGDAPPELGLALGVAAQALDVVVLGLLLHVGLVVGEGLEVGGGVALGAGRVGGVRGVCGVMFNCFVLFSLAKKIVYFFKMKQCVNLLKSKLCLGFVFAICYSLFKEYQ